MAMKLSKDEANISKFMMLTFYVKQISKRNKTTIIQKELLKKCDVLFARS